MKCPKCKAELDDDDVSDYAASELGLQKLDESELLGLQIPMSLRVLLWNRGHITASENPTYGAAIKILEEILS